MQPAKQKRSQATQDRIVRATKKLLRKRSFEDISIRQIVAEAQTSIGSFYARFRDKNALLPVLYAEYESTLQNRLARLAELLAQTSSLEETAGHIVEHFVVTFGEIPSLTRALYEYANRAPKARESKQHAERRYGHYQFLLDALLAFRADIGHPDPPRAVELAVYFMVVACRNRLLYPLAPQTRIVALSKAELRIELVKLMIGYLRH